MHACVSLTTGITCEDFRDWAGGTFSNIEAAWDRGDSKLAFRITPGGGDAPLKGGPPGPPGGGMPGRKGKGGLPRKEPPGRKGDRGGPPGNLGLRGPPGGTDPGRGTRRKGGRESGAAGLWVCFCK